MFFRERKLLYSNLIIGAQHTDNIFFRLTDPAIAATQLRPKGFFNTLNLLGNANYLCDFSQPLPPILQKKSQAFEFICFERTTELYLIDKDMLNALKNAKQLLANKGILMIFGYATDSPDIYKYLTKNFKYLLIYQYGIRENKIIFASQYPIKNYLLPSSINKPHEKYIATILAYTYQRALPQTQEIFDYSS